MGGSSTQVHCPPKQRQPNANIAIGRSFGILNQSGNTEDGGVGGGEEMERPLTVVLYITQLTDNLFF